MLVSTLVCTLLFLGASAAQNVDSSVTNNGEVAVSRELLVEFRKLNRYCNTRYPYQGSYYRPSYNNYRPNNNLNLGNLLGPLAIGAAGVVGAAALGSLIGNLVNPVTQAPIRAQQP